MPWGPPRGARGMRGFGRHEAILASRLLTPQFVGHPMRGMGPPGPGMPPMGRGVPNPHAFAAYPMMQVQTRGQFE